ncbi:MAG: DUF4115 domain-containing protein [Chloroflexi bacterium]|nr:DUF4115 domain-containing protein [Chloroflexota bacterium]MCY3939427.1 DUF4115 domain-containing protein [Chloroflexota bacterium]
MEADPAERGTVGAILRAAREEKNISVEAIAAGTHIRLNFLRDLERDNLGALPHKVYVTGFIKSYCDFLDIDPQYALDAYELQTATPGVRMMPDTRIPIGTGRRVSYRSLLILLAVLGVLVIATNFFFRNYRSPDASTTAASTVPPTETVTVQKVLPAFNVPTPAADSKAIAIFFEIVAEMNVNVQASVDGKQVFDGFMGPGEHKLWTASESVSLVTDNAGGLRVTVNGQPAGQLGRVGERLERRWEAN